MVVLQHKGCQYKISTLFLLWALFQPHNIRSWGRGGLVEFFGPLVLVGFLLFSFGRSASSGRVGVIPAHSLKEREIGVEILGTALFFGGPDLNDEECCVFKCFFRSLGVPLSFCKCCVGAMEVHCFLSR